MGRKPKNGYSEIDEDISIEARNFSIPASEQETVINFSRLNDFATISTSDTTMKTKFDKLCENSPDFYSVVSDDGYYKTYRVSDKSLVSCRSKKREMSEESKAAASQRLKDLHAEGRIGRKKKIDIAVDNRD